MNEKTIKAIQANLINSSVFAGSQISRDLLNYLFESHLRGEIPKEIIIARDIFGKDNFNQNEDTIVRVHMHNLRNKLEAYYKTEGKEDKTRLVIPKGHYALKFNTVDEKSQRSTRKMPAANIFYPLVIIFTLGFLVIYLWIRVSDVEKKLESYEIIENDNPIWKDYLQSDIKTDIILGNHFFFSEYSDDLQIWRYIRDLSINTNVELAVYKELFPNKLIEMTDEAYFPDGSIWSLPPILHVLYSIPNPIFLKRNKDITPDIIQENNIIFLGSIKTLGFFDQYLNSSHFQYDLYPHRIMYTYVDGSKTDTLNADFNQTTGYHRDLVLALKFPGPKNNTVFIMTSFFSSGLPEVAKYMTCSSSLKQLEKAFVDKYGKIPDFFEILFEVRGVEKTGFNLEIKYLNEISEDVKVW